MSVSEACRAASPTKADSVSKLQQQIEYHLRMVYDLRYQINQYAAISRLPPEIFSRIFHFARDACDIDHWKPRKAVKWTVVTHICRHWRDVAFNDPSLWARLPLRIPKWTTEMLQRSQEASLSVNMDISLIRNDVISNVFGQAHRLTQLIIEEPRYDLPLQQNFVNLGSLHVPNLEKLCLIRSGFRSAGLLVPEKLFVETVKLRHLELSGTDFSWDSHLLKSLTTLAIGNVSLSGVPSWLQLRSMLQRMPELHSLTLQHTLPSDSPEPTLTTSPILLPLLKMLCIDDDATKCRSFLRIVSFSDCLEVSKCSIRLQGQETETTICDILLSAGHMSSGACSSTRARGLMLRGTFEDSQPFHMAFKTVNDLLDLSMGNDMRCWRAEDLPGIKFEIWEERITRQGWDICNGIFTGMFQAFHFQTLLKLDLSGLDVPSPMPKFRDTLAATYGTLPMLISIIVGYYTASSLVDILSIGSNEQGGRDTADDSDVSFCNGSDKTEDSDVELDMSPIRSPSPVAFPALKNLELTDVPFDEDKHDPVFVIELALLEKCLINRSRRGVGILVLILDECHHLISRDVARLGELVPSVEWHEVKRRGSI